MLEIPHNFCLSYTNTHVIQMSPTHTSYRCHLHTRHMDVTYTHVIWMSPTRHIDVSYTYVIYTHMSFTHMSPTHMTYWWHLHTCVIWILPRHTNVLQTSHTSTFNKKQIKTSAMISYYTHNWLYEITFFLWKLLTTSFIYF